MGYATGILHRIQLNIYKAYKKGVSIEELAQRQEAADWCGSNIRGKIGMVCNGKRKHAGKLNGVPLSWEWVTDL